MSEKEGKHMMGYLHRETWSTVSKKTKAVTEPGVRGVGLGVLTNG